MMHPDRRSLITASGLAVAGLTLAQTAAAQASAAPSPKPLPFDPTAVPGLSEKLLTSHHDNNYASAVKRLGAIRADLAKLDFAAAPNYVLNGLKREELIAANSRTLHELYFAGLAAAAPPAAPLAQALERDFGSHERWAAEFSAMGKALGGGSGWVVLSWCRTEGRLINTWASDHTQTLAGGAPILALDMYEHAYAMDYGAKAAAYVDAFMKAMTWAEANRRFAGAAG